MCRPTLTLRPTVRNPILDDPNVGASDVCMDCRNELADFSMGWQLCETCRSLRVRSLQAQLAPKGQPQDDRLMEKLFDLWTIPEYVDWINGHSDPETHGGLMREVSDWAEYGITTARGVGEHLDACVEKERRKDGFDW